LVEQNQNIHHHHRRCICSARHTARTTAQYESDSEQKEECG